MFCFSLTLRDTASNQLYFLFYSRHQSPRELKQKLGCCQIKFSTSWKGWFFPWMCYLGREGRFFSVRGSHSLTITHYMKVKKLSYIYKSTCKQKRAWICFSNRYIQTASQRRIRPHKLLRLLLKDAHWFDLLPFVSRQQLHRFSNQAANAKRGHVWS